MSMAKRENKLIDCLATKPEGKSHIAVHADVITEPLTNERLKKIDSFFSFLLFCQRHRQDIPVAAPFFFVTVLQTKVLHENQTRWAQSFIRQIYTHTHTHTK